MIKIKLEDNYTSSEIVSKEKDDYNIFDYFDVFRKSLVILTFSDKTIEDAVIEIADEIIEKRKNK